MASDEHIRDLLPDYYLGQLPPEEAELVRHRLAHDPACRDELEEVARVLDLMPFAASPATLPADLKQRTLQKALGRDGVAPRQPQAHERGNRQSRRVGAIVAAAAAVLVVSLFAWAYLDLRQENQDLRADVEQLQQGQQDLVVVTVSGTRLAPDARGTAVVDSTSGGLALDVYNLPTPPEGHSYQAWLVESGGETVALGPMETDGRGDGRMTGQAPGPLNAYETVEITTEPTGTQDKSGPVYLQASL